MNNRRSFITGIKSTKLSSREKNFLRKYKPWGVILFTRNIKDIKQTKDLTTSIRKIFNDNKYPILIDQEGGRVNRLRNIISSVSYLLNHIPAKVIVKEVSDSPTFKFRAIPEIKKYADTSNLTHLYEKTKEPLFCKSKVLNDLIVASDTKVVVNYDADCILPISSYHQAYSAINDDQLDVVYPYGCGVYQWRAEYNSRIYEEFINCLDITTLDKKKVLCKKY